MQAPTVSMLPPSERSVVFTVDEEDEQDDSNGISAFQAHIANLKQETKARASAPPSSSPLSQALPNPPSSTTLSHLTYQWPGQTGNGNHLDVRPMSLDDLLSRHKIVIPLFQRRYCWTRVQIQQWWQDVSKGVGQHSTHKTMFKKDGEGTLICIDGQQRLTTTTLLLMALRAEARRQEGTANLIRKIDTILFPDPEALAGMKRWAKYQAFQLIRNSDTGKEENAFTMPSLSSGWLPPFETTLTPSYIDRAAYFEILCRDYVLEALERQLHNTAPQLKLSPTCQESIQHMAFDLFATELRRLTTATPSNHMSSCLNKLHQKQLLGFSIMYIELLTNDNVQQIFLWMQEKSVFGMGKLLHNPHPGVDFTPIDLARNLVVSSVMNEPLEEQVEFYQNCWIDPLEARFGTEGVSRILYQLVDRIDRASKNTKRYIGHMEERLEQYKVATPVSMQDAFARDKPMMVYARFHSHVQQRAFQLESGNPHAISRQVADSIVQDMVALGETMRL